MAISISINPYDMGLNMVEFAAEVNLNPFLTRALWSAVEAYNNSGSDIAATNTEKCIFWLRKEIERLERLTLSVTDYPNTKHEEDIERVNNAFFISNYRGKWVNAIRSAIVCDQYKEHTIKRFTKLIEDHQAWVAGDDKND